MPLTAGSRVGPYEITGLIGAGGMGEVYRARNTQLDRDVAIKILPDALARDPDRLMRFEREAKTLATLNHPHIAQIHGLEQVGSTRALVMELVEGEDLSQQIARGAIAIDDALAIARQIADALEAAHDRGIVHRDLKPANINLAGTFSRLTLDPGDEQGPVWTPDGKRVVYSSSQAGGNLNLYWWNADGSGPSERLLQSPNELRASSISPDGKLLAYTERHPETGHDIWILPLLGDRTPSALLRNSFQERLPAFSPDGKWLAYDSDESGRSQVYVMQFPDGRDRRQISVDGGTEPRWSTDGHELYFLNNGAMMAASHSSGSRLAPPTQLFQYAFGTSLNGPKYAVRPDGRFFAVAHGSTEPVREIRVIVNWFEDLKARVPIR